MRHNIPVLPAFPGSADPERRAFSHHAKTHRQPEVQERPQTPHRVHTGGNWNSEIEVIIDGRHLFPQDSGLYSCYPRRIIQ